MYIIWRPLFPVLAHAAAANKTIVFWCYRDPWSIDEWWLYTPCAFAQRQCLESRPRVTS